MTTEKMPPTIRYNCGRYAGYKAHRTHNEIVCDDCKAARNQWEKDRRAARDTAANRATLTDLQRRELTAAFKADGPFAIELVEQIIMGKLLRYT